MLTNLHESKDLPFASSLCGACKEICPVKIDIPRMLLHLRSKVVYDKTKPNTINEKFEGIFIRLWSLIVTKQKLSDVFISF